MHMSAFQVKRFVPLGIAALLLAIAPPALTQGVENTSNAFSSALAQGNNSFKLRSQHQADTGGAVSAIRAKTNSRSQPEFGGTYDKLTAAQRKLVDEWFARYKERTGKNLNPANAYSLVSVSIRTTFEGITNALANTTLTGKREIISVMPSIWWNPWIRSTAKSRARAAIHSSACMWL
jgi:hypothetical protein